MPATSGKFGGKDSLMPSGRQKTGSTREQEAALRSQTRIAEELAGMGKELFGSTRGLRTESIGDLESFLKTGKMPEGYMPDLQGLYRRGREDLEDQYGVARRDLLETTPSQSGQLNDQLRDLGVSRARNVGNLRTDIQTRVEVPLRQQLFSTALGVGFGQPPVAISSLGSAGANFGSAAGGFGAIATRAQAEQLEREQRAKEEWQNIGQMVGMAMT